MDSKKFIKYTYVRKFSKIIFEKSHEAGSYAFQINLLQKNVEIL